MSFKYADVQDNIKTKKNGSNCLQYEINLLKKINTFSYYKVSQVHDRNLKSLLISSLKNYH